MSTSRTREKADKVTFTQTEVTSAIAAAVPSGIISMWHGAASAIPSGWVICDGNNSTPNLTDKFIKSAAAAGATGGSATTGAHTLSTAEMPSHSHGTSGDGSNSTVGRDTVGGSQGQSSGNTYSQVSISATGGGGSHTHPQSEPIHFALIFIMKT
jgi:microcystin-dependent protein